MLLAAIIDPAIRATVIGHLALLFLTGAAGDTAVARNAAGAALDSFQPQTMDELTLAADTIAFSLQALDAVAQAADPAITPQKAARLRGSGVSLNKAAHRSRTALHRLRRDQALAATRPAPAAEPASAKATADHAIELVETAIGAIQAMGAQSAHSQPRQGRHTMSKREMLDRMAENARKTRAAEQLASQGHPQPASPIAQVA